MALQFVGDQDMQLLLKEMKLWSNGNWLEKRTVAAVLVEFRLVKKPEVAHSGIADIR